MLTLVGILCSHHYHSKYILKLSLYNVYKDTSLKCLILTIKKKNYCQNVDLEDCVVYLTVKRNSIVENSVVFGN